MNARELRKLLNDVPDDAPILVTGSDHSYYKPRIQVGQVLLEGQCETFQEFYPEVPIKKRDQILLAVIIGG